MNVHSAYGKQIKKQFTCNMEWYLQKIACSIECAYVQLGAKCKQVIFKNNSLLFFCLNELPLFTPLVSPSLITQ